MAMDKVEGPATILTLLGLELDASRQQIRLSPDKLRELLAGLQDWSTRSKATKRELLSLIDKLSFAAWAVPAGRLFLCRLISLGTTFHKLHHWVRLGCQDRADLAWWSEFLPTWNGSARFLDPNTTTVTNIDLYTDASGTLGCGGYFQGSWFHQLVAASPTAHCRKVHPVTRTVCYRGGCSQLGPPLEWTMDSFLL